MTVEERELRWAEAVRAERSGKTVAYERMLKEVATALRRSLAPRLVRAGLGAHRFSTFDDVPGGFILRNTEHRPSNANRCPGSHNIRVVPTDKRTSG